MKNNYCIIMAGGIGSRFWPMSTSKFPKQFHDVLGVGKTLLQQTYNRFLQLTPKENIFVITNKDYVALTLKQLPELDKNQVIGEPLMMNTAASNLYMAKKINKINPNAKMIITPSDHLILNENLFIEIVNKGLKIVEIEDKLITLGIQPTRPDTGYGYIQYLENNNFCKKVKTFTEKPNDELAKSFIASGDFLWNGGIFIWSTQSILKAFEKYQYEMFLSFSTVNDYYNTQKEKNKIETIYSDTSKISIDYAIMEKADNVYVIPSSFGWSDLGTWTSLFDNFKKDENNNAIKGKWIKAYNAHNNIIQSSNNKAVIVEGLDGYIVADTEKGLLICPIDKDQKVKEFVNELKLNKGETFL